MSALAMVTSLACAPATSPSRSPNTSSERGNNGAKASDTSASKPNSVGVGSSVESNTAGDEPGAAKVAGTASADSGEPAELDAEEQRYVGEYRHRNVDSVVQLMLLGDRTFCFQLMAGSLNMRAAGHWKIDPQGEIALQEVRPASVPMGVRQKPDDGDGQRSIVLHSYSLSDAPRPVLAVSKSPDAPATVRPLFPEAMNGWKSRYTLDPLPAGIRYIFVGLVERNLEDAPLRIRLWRFPVKPSGDLVVYYDARGQMPLWHATALFKDEVLHVSGDAFERQPHPSLSKVARVRFGCVADALSDTAPSETSSGSSVLSPSEEFELPVAALQGASWVAP